jgi:hypothetical protein
MKSKSYAKEEISSLAESLLVSPAGLRFMELVIKYSSNEKL